MAYSQPVQAPPGQRYGARKAQEDAQRAIPLPAGGGPPPAAPQQQAPAPPVPRPNVFGPSERPDEPITAGAVGGAGPTPILPDMSGTELLRALIVQGYDRNGVLRRMLERAGG